MPKYFIGTAGWSYKDWIPAFYPKGQSQNFDLLLFYSTYFNCVEVNSTYYTYLMPNTAIDWVRKVEKAEEFVFTVKLHQDFTHSRDYRMKNVADITNLLNILMRYERLGGLLIQFPYSFSFSSQAIEYIKDLNDIFCGYRRFLEVRHNSWNCKDALDFCNEWNITLCTIDQPEIGKAITFDPVFVNGRGYIRFHGRNVEEWKNSINSYGVAKTYEQQNERYRYLYSPGELNFIAKKIKEAEQKVKEVFVIMNNHPAGYAPANAIELISLLEGKTKIDMPPQMPKYFGNLKPLALNYEQDLFGN
ncbi:MAG: DUF72 domain-containing protein [Ignavibacteriaceae bacterium]|nr:DUF72 domain-containing protein [Ignavibacteriaceae bacterium]